MKTILVIGGYGNFGKRLATSLLQYYSVNLVIAGRSLEKAQQFQARAQTQFSKKIAVIKLDVLHDDLAQVFKQLRPFIVINASGPYQMQRNTKNNYRVAQACVEARCHYVDLADDRVFVSQFAANLNDRAEAAKVMLVTGASTVPGLTGAVIDYHKENFAKINTLNYGISPGNKTERGPATVGSILSYTGQPFLTKKEGEFVTIYGWQGLSRYDFGEPLGKRWMSYCDIPDLTLLPERYPEIQTITFKAGLEVSLLHLGLWFLSGFSRIRLIKNWSFATSFLTWLSERFMAWGSDAGGMFVELHGREANGGNKTLVWHLVAENGLGPNVPTIAAELLVKKMLEGKIKLGAMPCLGLFSLDEFFTVAKRWNIVQRVESKKS